MRTPTNTTAQINANPALGLLQAMEGPGAIERQEALGQRELAESEVIPTKVIGMDAKEAEKKLAALGFVLGATVEGDPLFRAAQLPAGWKIAPSDHSMWSYILDETGKKRCSIFYKAAFYDRCAHMGIEA